MVDDDAENKEQGRTPLAYGKFRPRAQSVLRRLKIDTVSLFLHADLDRLQCPQLGSTTRCELKKMQETLRDMQEQGTLENWLWSPSKSQQEVEAVSLSQPAYFPIETDFIITAQGYIDLAALWLTIVRHLAANEREIYILTRRFNLDGQGRLPLEELKPILKISRERVRQIEAQALLRLKNSW